MVSKSVSKTVPPIWNPSLECGFFGNELKCQRTLNLHRILIAQININSVRNKFEYPVNRVRGNVDIIMISETKTNDGNFPTR